VAQVILGGIAASIMTVVSIVFAILLMTLTLASMQVAGCAERLTENEMKSVQLRQEALEAYLISRQGIAP